MPQIVAQMWDTCASELVEKNINGNGNFSRGSKRKKNPLGIDVPFPKQRQQFMPEAIVIEEPGAKRQCFLRRGSKLALKFPHLVQADAPT